MAKKAKLVINLDDKSAAKVANAIIVESQARQSTFLDGFEKALPLLPISDELKTGFEEAISKQRVRLKKKD